MKIAKFSKVSKTSLRNSKVVSEFMNQRFLFLFFLWVCFLSYQVQAKNIQGVAHVIQKSRRSQIDMDVAVKLNESGARFLALDDFGGVIFESSGKGLPKTLSLPLSESEFLSILKYELPSEFIEREGNGEVYWAHPKKKKLNIHFSEFINQAGSVYPQKIDIRYKKHYFDLIWLKVTLPK